uniref:Ig-like domain-containing protein n=1 Tax=Gasterosteus aculeatus aculeatus TaxID=481459 RepID=G3Q926_GASAC
MTSAKFIFYLICLFLGKMGELCFSDFSLNLLKCVATPDGIASDVFLSNPRFKVVNENGRNHLTITDLEINDSATYNCISGNEYELEFLATTTVSVQGSSSNIPTLIHQSHSETIQPGGSVTLNCTVQTGTCDGQHSVYWFKDSEESHPALIYTDGGSTDQCERKANTQTHTCDYNLPMESLNLSHAGTYYCAVASCGHIMFGNGTKLDIKDKLLVTEVGKWYCQREKAQVARRE